MLNFVKITALLKKLLKSWFDEILFDESKFLIFPYSTLYMQIFFVFSHCTVAINFNYGGDVNTIQKVK